MQSLAEMKAGEECTIKWMLGNPQIMEFMHQYHIKEGSLIHIFWQGNGGMIIGTGKVRLAIDLEVAERIKV